MTERKKQNTDSLREAFERIPEEVLKQPVHLIEPVAPDHEKKNMGYVVRRCGSNGGEELLFITEFIESTCP